MKRFLLVCGLALLLVPAAFAGTPTVSSSENTIVLDTVFSWSGCGYQPGQVVRLQTSGETTSGEYEIVDANGCFLSEGWLLSSLYYGPGVETASVYSIKTPSGKSQKLLASVSVQVVSA